MNGSGVVRRLLVGVPVRAAVRSSDRWPRREPYPVERLRPDFGLSGAT
jgi:hypothetical protein